MTMTKSELVTSVSAATGMPCEAAGKAVNATVNSIIEAIGKGDTVTIPGFGTFQSRLRQEHMGRNPQTGEEMILPACKVPTFKSGKRMKEAVRNG